MEDKSMIVKIESLFIKILVFYVLYAI